MAEHACFVVERTNRARAWLRCYIGGSSCPTENGYHDNRSPIGEVDETPDAGGYTRSPRARDYAGDLRWPAACACGWPLGMPTAEWLEEAGDSDGTRDEDGRTWQVFTKTLYRRVDNGETGTLDDLGPGAMFDAVWLTDNYRGPDGKAWSVVLPPGGDAHVWHIYGPSYKGGVQGPKWTVTGTAPRLTASPSILTAQYHGHLVDGVLRD